MRIGSLFSGIGGLELGLEWSGIGRTVWQVESDHRCRAVLEKHWPDARRFDDVKGVGAANLDAVDLICGGFPCQDVSSAGKRVGIRGAKSGLWIEFRRIVAELRPSWVVVENVASGALAWVDAVRGDLAQCGYASLPVPLAACDVGAPHRRQRIFIVATNLDAHRESFGAIHAEMAGTSAPTTNVDRAAVRVKQRRRGRAQRQGATIPRYDGWRTPEPSMVRMVHGVPTRVDGATARRAALGNAVTPQCAEVIGHIVLELARAG